MDLGLTGKTFVVGGGSKGLGRATAECLIAEGARVILLSRSNDNLDAAVTALGERAIGCAVDMADPDAATTIAAAVDAHFGGRLDGLVINAGGPPAGDTFDLTDDQWLASYQLLIGGPLRVVRTLLPGMNDGAAILFVTSITTRQPVVNLDTSNVLRPGVAALVKTLARELGPKIRVNSLGTGRMETDRIKSLDDARAKTLGISVDEQKAAEAKAIPLGRAGDPKEFGRFATFLLSPAASYVSGLNALVDGGMNSSLP